MFFHRDKSRILSTAFAVVAGALVSACATFDPVHEGKFVFQGIVKDEQGKPVPNAWVKVRGWETLTDAQGKWRQEQVVHCGTLKEHMSGFEENDALLVSLEGFAPSEEKFFVKHPAYFESCQAEQNLAFDTTLVREEIEKKQTHEVTKIKPKEDPPTIPWSKEKTYHSKTKGTDL
jgi:hypothetical protein